MGPTEKERRRVLYDDLLLNGLHLMERCEGLFVIGPPPPFETLDSLLRESEELLIAIANCRQPADERLEILKEVNANLTFQRLKHFAE